MACTDLILDNIAFDFCASRQPGGVKAKVYAARREDISGLAVDATTGQLETLTLKPGKRLYMLEGKKFTNTGSTEFTRSENGPLVYPQSFTFVAFTNSQLQRNAINAMAQQDGWTFFVPLNNSTVLVFGYSLPPYDNLGSGLSVTGLTESLGTAMADATSIPITFTGSEMNLPVLYAETGGFVATLDFLDALVESTTPAS